MKQKFILVTIAAYSSLLLANPGAPATHSWKKAAASYFTGIRPRDLSTNTLTKMVVPAVVLHSLEHFVCHNNTVGRFVTGDTNNPNKKSALALWITFKLLHHLVPSILKNGVSGKALSRGINSFSYPGHLASALLSASFLPHSTQRAWSLRLASLALFIAQMAWRYSLVKRIEKECAALSINPAFEYSFTEPSPEHTRLPGYPYQQLELLAKELVLTNLNRNAWQIHFNQEFRDPNKSQAIRNHRKLNATLLHAEPGLSEPQVLALVIHGSMLFVKLLTGRLTFIPRNVFDQLSPKLQCDINHANEHELMYKIYSLTNPLTEKALGLATYTHWTEYSAWDAFDKKRMDKARDDLLEQALKNKYFSFSSDDVDQNDPEIANHLSCNKHIYDKGGVETHIKQLEAESGTLLDESKKQKLRDIYASSLKKAVKSLQAKRRALKALHAHDFHYHGIPYLEELYKQDPTAFTQNPPLNYMESVLAFFGERGSELLANKEGRLKARILAHFVLKHKPASHLAKTFLQMASHTDPGDDYGDPLDFDLRNPEAPVPGTISWLGITLPPTPY